MSSLPKHDPVAALHRLRVAERALDGPFDREASLRLDECVIAYEDRLGKILPGPWGRE